MKIKTTLATGVILTLITSNSILLHQYKTDMENYQKKINSQGQIIKQQDINIHKQKVYITDQTQVVKDLQQQNNHLMQQKDNLQTQLNNANSKLKSFKYFNVTAYTSGYESTQKRKGEDGYGITASGTKAEQGRTIACPPSLKFGTKLDIENVGIRTCEDHGSAIVGNHIDLYFENVNDALDFGRKNLLVEILN